MQTAQTPATTAPGSQFCKPLTCRHKIPYAGKESPEETRVLKSPKSINADTTMASNEHAAVVDGFITGSFLHVGCVMSGVLAAGQNLVGVGIIPGTKIVSQASGINGTIGGLGTYNINFPQTVAGAPIFAESIKVRAPERSITPAVIKTSELEKARKPRAVKTKNAIVAALLLRKSGTTNAEILEVTGWPSVSVPGQAKAAGLTLRKEKVPGKPTRYFGSK